MHSKGNSTATLELEYEEYKDDSFHSIQQNTGEVDKSLEQNPPQLVESGLEPDCGNNDDLKSESIVQSSKR